MNVFMFSLLNYDFSEKEYGWIFAFIAFVIIGSAQLNHLLLKRFRSSQIIKTTLLYQTCMGVILITGTWFGWFNKLEFIGLIALFLSGHGLTNPNANALSLAPFSKHTGSAASLSGSFRMMMGGLASALVSVFHDGTSMPMIGVMVFCILGGLVILLVGRSIMKFTADEPDLEGKF